MSRKRLIQTHRLIEHSTWVLKTYFEVPQDLQYLHEVNDRTTARQFIRELMLPTTTSNQRTREQEYLQALLELSHPVFEAQRASNRIRSARPNIRSDRASGALIPAARDLCYETYNLRERLKTFMTSAQNVCRVKDQSKPCVKSLAQALRAYDRVNDRLIRYRNFLVHGPKGRFDEFSDLRLAELGAIILHDDLWLEYKNVFSEYICEWNRLAGVLIQSMETLVMRVTVENEKAITEKRFSFT